MLKRKNKRFLSIVLAAAMIIGLFPVTAFADENSATWTQVSSVDELSTALTNGGNIQLDADITVDNAQNWTITKDVVLDLNGKKLTNNVDQLNYYIMKVSEGSLTITDNSSNHDGIIESTSTTHGYGIQLRSGGQFTLLNGTIKTTQETVDIYTSAENCSITISGGQLISSSDSALCVRGENTKVDITGGTLQSDGRTGIYVSNYGEPDSIVINMSGGKLIHNNGRSGAMQIYNGATVNISGNAEIQAQYQGLQVQENTVLNIAGGTISAGSDAVAAEDNSSVNISGGAISTTSNGTSTYAVSADDNATVNISGGTVTSAKPSNNVGGNSENITIVGGSFQQDVSQYVPEGNKVDENGNVVVDDTKAVATVNNIGYASLQAAIDAAGLNNGTVTLLKNIELTDGVEISGTVTLDLNGFTITDSATQWSPSEKVDYLLAVKREANLTINDSSVAKTGAITAQNKAVSCAVKITLPEDTSDTAATLTVNGGTLTGYYYGISGNGTRHNTDITINGGTVEGTNGTGIYHPQDGALEVNGGSVIGLNSAIELRSGKLTISDGTFISKASVYEAEPNGSGTTVSGAAIAVSQHTTKKAINVTITGGTFRGPKAFVETGVQGTPEDIALTINGGTFESAVESDDITNFIESGHFANPVDSTLLADNLNTQLTDADNAVAPYSYYSSVQAAVNAADEGDTVTILVNSDEDVTVSKPIKIETADSVVYTGTVSAGNGYDVVIGEDGVITIVKEPPYTGKFSYEIFTTVGDNGTIDVDRYATEGDKVTITVSPDEAYMLDDMSVTSGGKDVEVTDNGDGTYTFTMPRGDVKIEVTFAEDPNWEEEPAMPFVDVDENDWFYDVVLYAYENGLMTGTSADTFAPNTATTRGMIVSMLARLEGVTSAESAGFTDVVDNDWYATAVNWAASEGIVNGFEDDTFRPNAPITREQMAAILYNYADYKGYDVSARADLSDYADAASISSWAEDVLAWANAEGLINGMTATTIDPQGATTRAQTAAMFERFLTAHAE